MDLVRGAVFAPFSRALLTNNFRSLIDSDIGEDTAVTTLLATANSLH